MADLSALQAVPGGQIGSGIAQVFNPNQTLGILRADQARADQLRAMEEQRKARQAALEAKRREDEAVTAEFEVSKGLDFYEPLKQIQDEEIGALQRDWAKMNPQQRKQALADMNFRFKSRNEWAATQKAEFDAADERLKKYYNVDPVGRKVFIDAETKGKPDFFKKGGLASSYASGVKADPNSVKWNVMGDDLVKAVGETQFKYTDADGKERTATYANLLEDPKLSRDGVKPTLSYRKAREVADKMPEAQEAIDVYVANRAKQLAADPANAKMTQAAIEKMAENEALDRLFKHRFDVKGELDTQTNVGKARSAAVGSKLPEFSGIAAPRQEPVYFKDKNAGDKETMEMVRFPDAYTWQSAKVPIAGSNNIRVIPIGTMPSFMRPDADNKMVPDKDAKESFEKLLKPNGDGTYTLVADFTAKTPTLATTYILKEDAVVPTFDEAGKKTGTVKKGKNTLISMEQAAALPSGKYNKQKSYIFSPVAPQVEDPETGRLKKMPFSDIRLVADMESLTELTAALRPPSGGRFSRTTRKK